MDFIVMISALFAGALVEDVTPTWAFAGRAEAPVVLGVVIYYALNRSSRLMLVAAAVGGLLCDSLSGLPLGFSVLCFSAVAAVVRKYRNIVFSGKWITHMCFGTAAAVGYTLMLYILLLLTQPVFREAPLSWVAAKIAGVCVLGALITPLTFTAVQGLDRMMGNILTANAE